MIRCPRSPGLVLAALLALISQAVAQPPDVPCRPRENLTQSFAATLPPMPELNRVPPLLRRNLTGCLLFSIHPLLALVPLDQAHTVRGSSCPVLCGNQRTKTPTASVCPYLRQKAQECQIHVVAKPALMPDVLDNLERLRQTDDLLEMAQTLTWTGRLSEACACLDAVRQLCPGSRQDEEARRMMASMQVALGEIVKAETTKRCLEDLGSEDWERVSYTEHPSHLSPDPVTGSIADLDCPGQVLRLGAGFDANGAMILNGGLTVHGTTFNVQYRQGSVSFWKTPDPARYNGVMEND